MGQLISGAVYLYCGVLALLLLGVHMDVRYRSSLSRKNRRLLLATAVMLLCEGVAICFLRGTGLPYTLLSVTSTACFYAVILLYLLYVAEVLGPGRGKSAKVLCAINAVCSVSGFLYWCADYVYPFFYDVHTYAVTDRALYVLGAVPGCLSVALNCLLIMLNHKQTPFRDLSLLMLLPLLPFVSYLVGWFVPGLSLQYALIFASLLLNHFRFDARKDRELENRTREAQTLRLQNTLERVKPHFIYNVLTSIYYLCEKDPPTAQKAVGDFSLFLREALDHAEQHEVIPFKKELDLIRYYEQLEHIRFGDRFRIAYAIGTEDFSLPPFCVQPLVENAIKHGVKSGADVCIRIETRETDREYLVTVSDNGSGFDPDATDLNGKPSGIRNIRELMELTGSGALEVQSVAGNGTTALLRVSKKRAAAKLS